MKWCSHTVGEVKVRAREREREIGEAGISSVIIANKVVVVPSASQAIVHRLSPFAWHISPLSRREEAYVLGQIKRTRKVNYC